MLPHNQSIVHLSIWSTTALSGIFSFGERDRVLLRPYFSARTNTQPHSTVRCDFFHRIPLYRSRSGMFRRQIRWLQQQDQQLNARVIHNERGSSSSAGTLLVTFKSSHSLCSNFHVVRTTSKTVSSVRFYKRRMKKVETTTIILTCCCDTPFRMEPKYPIRNA